jgi:thiol-disulfide isomerase/thioredoxin
MHIEVRSERGGIPSGWDARNGTSKSRSGMGTLSRRFFLSSSGAIVTAASAPHLAVAAGARSGSWCLPLTKVANADAYDFSLRLLDANDAIFTLSDYLGRPVWLNFFASWCPPCNDEAADIVAIAAKYGDALAVIGIDVRESADKARGFRVKHNIPYPIALDETGSVFRALGLKQYPTHVFVDAIGMISCISVGDLTAEQMDNEVSVAAARHPATSPGRPQ